MRDKIFLFFKLIFPYAYTLRPMLSQIVYFLQIVRFAQSRKRGIRFRNYIHVWVRSFARQILF